MRRRRSRSASYANSASHLRSKCGRLPAWLEACPVAPGDTIESMKAIAVLLAAAAVMPNLDQLKQMDARFAPVKIAYDASKLSPGDQKALVKLIEAARE